MDKICPFLMITEGATGFCVEGECAWWIILSQECAIKDICEKLKNLAR